MNCERVKEWLPHYIEGLLSPERELIIRLHIESCPGCVQSLEEAREMAEFWREMERNIDVQDVGHIPDLTAAVMAEIELIEAGRSKRVNESAPSRRRYTPRTSWVHYSLAASLTFLLFQFGVFEGLAYQISEINGQMSNSVNVWFGSQSTQLFNK
ncbi:zf-HC2 domain-containing protein [Paenibacillus sp. BR2-3]|uniref:anti-sigma factor family protein n=1 Tax=Paenibacillus sp. BR2-3 TaxID=3048494 RepID=UPI003977CFB0